MRSLQTSLLLLIAFGFASIETRAAPCLPVKVRNPEGNYIVPGVRGDIVFARVNGRELSLDAYVQKHGNRRPGVIVIHGGGWVNGSRIAFVGQFLEMLTRAGYNWFSIDYRLGGIQSYKEAMDDLRAAIDFVRCRAKDFRIDPNNIALLGEDAGAHLAAMVAAEKPAGVKAAVMIGGFHDLREIPNIKSQIPDPELLIEASPIIRVTKTMPAALVVHGTADREAPPELAARYCDAIRTSGGRCQYLPVDGAIHRAENWLPRQWGYKTSVLSWLNREMQLKFPDHEPYDTNLKKGIVFSFRHQLKLDAYIPNGPGPFPAVIIVHGGGWEAGDKVTYITPLLEPLAKAGFAWFSIDYRLTPQHLHQDQIEDLQEAIRFVRAYEKAFRIAPDRIAIIGESASGQMTALVATRGRSVTASGRRRVRLDGDPDSRMDIEVAAAVSFYGVYDFEAMTKELTPRSIPVRLFGITKLNDEARTTMRRYSPLHNIRDNTMPLLLICGTKDGLLAQHEAFATELERAGADFDAFTLDGAPHGMENWEGHPDWMFYKTKLINWLKERLAP
jgi:alpha-L-fucosidase 2